MVLTNVYFLIRRYGVQDVFEVEDLLELRNIPKVTKCLIQLSKLVMQQFYFISIYMYALEHFLFQAASDKENLLNCMN